MKKLIYLSLALALAFTSCQKDTLFIVNGTGSNELITSIIIPSDDYSAGVPAIKTNTNYSYDYNCYYDNTKQGTFQSSYTTLVSSIDIKVNPSTAALDDVSWKIVRRSTSTSEQTVFSGEVTAESSSELVTLNLSDDSENFFDETGDYLYSIVAVYSDGTEVTSDASCLIDGGSDTLSEIFLGIEANGVLYYSFDEILLDSNYMEVDFPALYGKTVNGETLSFDKMGLDDSQYTLSPMYINASGGTLSISGLEYNDEYEHGEANILKWAIKPHSIYSDYNYDEFNGYASLQFGVYTPDNNDIIEPIICYFATYMDDIELNRTATVSNSGEQTFQILKELTDDDDMLLQRVNGDNNTGYLWNEFINKYTSVDPAYAKEPIYYVDGQVSTDLKLVYTYSSYYFGIEIKSPLSVGEHTIQVILSSNQNPTRIIDTVTLTVTD